MNYTNAVQNYLKFAALHTLLKKEIKTVFQSSIHAVKLNT